MIEQQHLKIDLGKSLIVSDANIKNLDGSRCRHDDDTIKSILLAVIAGDSYRRIEKKYSIDRRSIVGLVVKYRNEIPALKKDLSLKLQQFQRLSADRLIDEIDEIDINKLPIALGIIIDKQQLIDGEATTRVETILNQHSDFNAMISSLPVAEPIPTGEKILQKERLEDHSNKNLENNNE